ncbi:MAG: hypothetical protein H6727_07620 [Myxococcales bacterium]|nr:hypothetical protein [Myxococcales bacterium]
MKKRVLFGLLGLMAWFGIVACAPLADMPEIAIRVGELQDNVNGVTLWLLPPGYTGSAVSCQDLLDRKASFDSQLFNEKKAKSVIIAFGQQESVTSTVEGIEPGSYLFVVGGYKDNVQEPSNLRYIGCQEGKVELGKKLALSIFLSMVPVAP